MEHVYIVHIKSIDLSLPDNVVSPGIALAISAIAFPWSRLLASDTVGDVGINVGVDEEEDVDHNLIAWKGWNSLNSIYLHYWGSH